MAIPSAAVALIKSHRGQPESNSFHTGKLKYGLCVRHVLSQIEANPIKWSESLCRELCAPGKQMTNFTNGLKGFPIDRYIHPATAFGNTVRIEMSTKGACRHGLRSWHRYRFYFGSPFSSIQRSTWPCCAISLPSG